MTDPITLPRATVQQVLGAIDLYQRNEHCEDEFLIAGHFLRTALEQQQAEALQAMNDQLTTGTSIMLDGKRVAPASIYKQAEPIGWLDGNDKLAEFMHRDLKAEHDKRGSATPREFTVPVYTAPPQRKPLPKGEWPKHKSPYVKDEYIGYAQSDLDDYAMQVLAAHGIKEGT